MVWNAGGVSSPVGTVWGPGWRRCHLEGGLSKVSGGQMIEIGGTFDQRAESPLREGSLQLSVKRAFDLFTGLILLAIASPVMLFLWLLIRSDGGCGLYGHPRIGKDGREFRCLKFRTMVTDADVALPQLLDTDPVARAEWERSHKLTSDPRVTQFGRVLRATSLDELPQLFNVLRGDMSLVGPRPVVRDELDQFYHGDAREAYLSVRPGVTGLWQISGRSDASYDQRVSLDTKYVGSSSLWLDIVILIKTVAVVLRQRGAY
jgi:exopolysaccharide production protein ExoY